MKMKKKLLVLAVIVFAASGNSDAFAQALATASASATVIAPISLTKNVDMNFGNIAVSVSTGGTVMLAPAGTRTTGGGGGVTLPATSGTVAAASFTVSGAASYTYAITLPSTVTISDLGGHNMTVNGFSSTPSSTGTLSGGGTSTVKVGATLNVASAQSPGSYSNASGVPVTVNYN
jgi:uncharacterized protein DUF4402